MAFEDLIGKSIHEPNLLELIISEIRANYSNYQNTCFFLKLSKSEELKTSHLTWIKTFNDAYDLGDYYYDTKFERACILIKFLEGHYELLCEGFYWVDRFKIWPEKLSTRRGFKVGGFREGIPMCPREILEGFGELTTTLALSKGSKAIS